MDDELDLSRREFVQTGTVGLASLGVGSPLQVNAPTGGQPNEEYEFQGVADLLGQASARPAPGDPFFDNKVYFAYRYTASDTGAVSTITQADVPNGSWTPINYIQRQPVFSSDDLPDPTNGSHTLAGQTAYVFNGFVTSPYGLDISNGPALLGRHASMDGFIHTGGATAIVGTDGGYFQDSLYVHAPGGTIYNISGDQTTEMLVTDSAFSDAAGLGDIVSLGTVTGFRVPTWKNCNFEDFADGITFDGSPDKIFVSSSPLRNPVGSGVDIFTIAGTANVSIVDFTDNYVKDVQSDTVVWRIEAGGEPSEVFQYRGTLADTSFNPDNAIVGPNSSPTVEPYWVADSHPIRDSSVAGELYLDGSTTVNITTQDQYEEVNGTTQTGNESERVLQASNGTIQYIGTKDVNVQVAINTSMTGANGRTYEIAVAKNGTVEPASSMEVEAGGQNAPVNPSTGAIEDLEPNDTISLQVRNRDGTEDATFSAYIISFMD